MFAKNKHIFFEDLGEIDYKTCWDYQELLQQKTVQQKTDNRNAPEPAPTSNHLLLVTHPHVYTMGKSGNENHLLVNDAFLKTIKATYYKINRGGDITYHGPGQLVVYPILDLENFFTDIHKYLRLLEEVIIKTLADFNIIAGRNPGETGVWISAETKQARKICAMGVHCSRWVTKHGLALNVNTDLTYFNHIVPCGISDKAVTSLQKELGVEVSINEVKQKVLHYFSEVFECEILKAPAVKNK
ncbi:MAG: lipoyl(octanoyl) transferase LipB [Bacteroidetes bacterium]|nr:lipoyl(octanoyl) transferase LipB [Bacteroidota bacterium]